MKAKPEPIRVVVIDDSPTACELLVAMFQDTEGIQVVGVGYNGEDAVRLAKRLRPDVVTMDVRMPKMDGLEATRHIMRDVPTPIVIVTGSNFMRAEATLTFDALRAGALTVVSKPGLADPETCDKVVQAVRLMSEVAVVRHWDRRRSKLVEGKDRKPSPALSKVEGPVAPSFSTDADRQRRVQMVGIAASTGGPAALASVLGALPPDFPAPVLVVQHVTRGFVAGLAEWLDGETPLRVSLTSHGDTPQPGDVLLPPDDYHIQVNAQEVVELCKEPPYKGLRPSANYMFRSLACTYGPGAVGVVLTGMGDDGAEGLEALHLAGGLTLAQDEQSCVVYGMPREAVARNAVDRVLTLEQIALTLDKLTHHQE
jgi:two-component system chemotaxis response regulator CheB